MTPLNLQEAATELGVHYQTAYRWVREGALSATKAPGRGYEISQDEVARFLERRLVPTSPPERLHVRDWPHQVQRLLAALVDGDERTAFAQIDRLVAGSVSVLDLCDHLVAPVLREIGERWHDGTLSIAHEHRATAICDRLLARIAISPRGRPRGTAVIVMPEGDIHAMASTMANLVLREDRWKTHHLGAGLPAVDVITMVNIVDADLVVITTAYPDAEPASRKLEQRLVSLGRTVLTGAPGMTLHQLVEQARAATGAMAGD